MKRTCLILGALLFFGALLPGLLQVSALYAQTTGNARGTWGLNTSAGFMPNALKDPSLPFEFGGSAGVSGNFLVYKDLFVGLDIAAMIGSAGERSFRPGIGTTGRLGWMINRNWRLTGGAGIMYVGRALNLDFYNTTTDALLLDYNLQVGLGQGGYGIIGYLGYGRVRGIMLSIGFGL